MICCFIDPPGFQTYSDLIGLEQLVYAYADYPELFGELVEMYEKQAVIKMEMAIDAKIESILTGGWEKLYCGIWLHLVFQPM